jgi:hypothetical protein
VVRGSISKTVDSRGRGPRRGGDKVRWQVRFDLPADNGRRRQRQITVATRREAKFLLAHVQTARVALAGRATAESADRWLREQSSSR